MLRRGGERFLRRQLLPAHSSLSRGTITAARILLGAPRDGAVQILRPFSSSPLVEQLEDSNDSDDASSSSLAASDTTVHVTRTTRPRLAELRAKLSAESPASNKRGLQQYQPLLSKKKNSKENGLLSTTIHPQQDDDDHTDQSSINKLQALRLQLAHLPDPAPEHVLTDRHRRRHTYLRLSVTERCNLRCTYCMPAAGVPLQPASHLLSTTELLTLAQHFAQQLGVTKFRLTGGEPTLRADLLAIVDGLSKLQPQSIGMTTNGIALGGTNGKLQALHQAGLTGLNVSLDTVDPDEFAALTRRPASYLQRVRHCLEQAVEIASDSNNNFTVKLNCVVMRGTNDHGVPDLIRLAEQYDGHLQVRFIEYMPFSENGWNWDRCVPYAELLQRLRQQHEMELQPLPAEDPHDTTKWFTYNHPNSSTTTTKIGFITSMSQHFCGTCNRLRLTADGQIKVCLFDGRTDVSLRDALRAHWSQKELNKLIHYAAVQTKHAALGGHRDPADIMKDAGNNRPMTLIGG